MEEQKLTEGWAWLFGCGEKWHYFVNQESLCGKYIKFTKGGLEQGNDNSPDNCKACRKKLERCNQQESKK